MGMELQGFYSTACKRFSSFSSVSMHCVQWRKLSTAPVQSGQKHGTPSMPVCMEHICSPVLGTAPWVGSAETQTLSSTSTQKAPLAFLSTLLYLCWLKAIIPISQRWSKLPKAIEWISAHCGLECKRGAPYSQACISSPSLCCIPLGNQAFASTGCARTC